MSKINSDPNFSISFGANKDQSERSINNLDQMDDNFDAFNDETFGEIDSTDWESEHEKLMSMTAFNGSDPNDNKTDNNLYKNNYIKNTSVYESQTEEDSNLDDLIVKSISNLGLEDEDFDDPAIMTYARSSKPLNTNSMSDSNRRLSRSSPPPPAFLSYEEYSASPKTQSIWSTTPNDSTLTSTPVPTQLPQTQPPPTQPTPIRNIGSIQMRTLEDIENDMINSNVDYLSGFQSLPSKRPINVEDLEANLFRDATNHRIITETPTQKTDSWSPFGINPMDNYTPNGRNHSEVMSNFQTIENNMRTGLRGGSETNRSDNDINLKTVQMMASEVMKEPIDPLLKAQTLSEIERQLISNHNSPQKQIIQHKNVQQNVAQPLPKSPNQVSGSPGHSAFMATTPTHSDLIQSPMQRVIPPNLAIRFANAAQNRVNPLYNPINRHPVQQIMPGMVPAIGRTLFYPALIPNSQRIFPFGMQSRPLIHPILNPLNLHQQQQQHLHQQYLQRQHMYQNSRQSNRYYDDNTDDDDFSGLMTQREKEWLIKIQQMQTELKDPYVDDYYYVTHISRKIAAKAASVKDNKTTPSLLLPERPKPPPEPETPKYIPIQFEGSLGKIQVSNVNCPRKLLDNPKLNKTNTSPNEPTSTETKVITKSEVQRFRKLLLEIEKLYVVLINIDDEDKRIGALPEEARIPHLETRRQLCERLFKGLTNETKDKINLEVVQIKKGLALLFRSLSYLSDESQRSVIISDLLNANNFRQYVIKPKVRLDYGLMLVNAIKNLNNCDALQTVVDNINNISVIIKSEYGQLIIESLINQWEKLEINGQNRSKWSIFVSSVLDESVDLPEITKLCRNHLESLQLLPKNFS